MRFGDLISRNSFADINSAVWKPKQDGIKDPNALSEEDLQNSKDIYAEACNDFGFTINESKTEVMHQPVPGTIYRKPHGICNGQTLASHRLNFTYLSSTLSRNASLDEIASCQDYMYPRQAQILVK